MFCMRNITGQNIQTARKLRNLTQEELAIRLQIAGMKHTRNTIAKIENGFRQVTDIELKAIADVMNIPISSLFIEVGISAGH